MGCWGVNRDQLSLKWGLRQELGWLHALCLPALHVNDAVCRSKGAVCRPALTLRCTLQALQPKLEAMEASWYRLHSISGADTPEEVISYWEGESSQSRAHAC